MAVYKVPQDVEADDKLIGPFSFKQFVFIIITTASLYMAYVLWSVSPVLALLPMPFAIFFGILGFWPRRKQPIEVYLAAIVHFWTKPRKRIWNQEGHVEHVHISVPKKIEHKFTDGLSRGEVYSNLENLAKTLDSRGWSAKNIEVQDIAYNTAGAQTPSDRLVMPQPNYTQSAQPIDIHQRDDILDANNNAVAQNFDQLSRQATNNTRQEAIDQMQAAAEAPAPKKPKKSGAHKSKKQSNSAMNTAPSAAILNLSKNSDLSVSTLAKEANDAMPSDTTIELH